MEPSKHLLTQTAVAAAITVLIPVGAMHAQKAPAMANEKTMSESEISGF